jgi:hypothetical protein
VEYEDSIVKQIQPVPADYPHVAVIVWWDEPAGWSAWTEPVVALALVHHPARHPEDLSVQSIEAVILHEGHYQTLAEVEAWSGDHLSTGLCTKDPEGWELARLIERGELRRSVAQDRRIRLQAAQGKARA